MMGNRQRKAVRAENNDPINFTCGKCRQVHKYTEGFNCPNMPMSENEPETPPEEAP